jgi:glutamate formiminotransferase
VTGTLPTDGSAAGTDVLECIVNVSEGRDRAVVSALAETCGDCLLDVHSDRYHHRSVLTLGGAAQMVEVAARDLARRAVHLLDLRRHSGVHPRFGVLDVVPFVSLEGWPLRDSSSGRAAEARDAFARWAASELGLPVFLYGPERSLPEIRKRAWEDLGPDLGPGAPHSSAGAVAVGYRPIMVAYNLWTTDADLDRARAAAAAVRSPSVRALAFRLGDDVQVSCNLVQPFVVGPDRIWDQVAAMMPLARAELVGLVPQALLSTVPGDRWAELDLALERTIEARLRLRDPRCTGPG